MEKQISLPLVLQMDWYALEPNMKQHVSHLMILIIMLFYIEIYFKYNYKFINIREGVDYFLGYYIIKRA